MKTPTKLIACMTIAAMVTGCGNHPVRVAHPKPDSAETQLAGLAPTTVSMSADDTKPVDTSADGNAGVPSAQSKPPEDKSINPAVLVVNPVTGAVAGGALGAVGGAVVGTLKCLPLLLLAPVCGVAGAAVVGVGGAVKGAQLGASKMEELNRK